MQIIGRDGRTRDGETLEDGERIRVGLTFMDSAQRAIARASTGSHAVTDGFGNSDLYALRRPGPRFSTQRTTTDAARQEAYDAVNKADAEAWKTPPVTPPPITQAQPRAVPREDAKPALVEDREAVLREVALRDENAWRGNQ